MTVKILEEDTVTMQGLRYNARNHYNISISLQLSPFIYNSFGTILHSTYSLPPLTRHRKGNENPVELAGVELARE